MQYTITINQFAVMSAGLDLDVVDLSIFDFIKHYAHSEKCMKLQTESGAYFWISHTMIIQELPILGISTGAGIVKRINKLIDAGLLTRHPNCDLMRKTFYKFGPNYDKVLFASHNESLQPTTNVGGPDNESLRISHNESLRNHNTSNHTTIEQNIPADGGLFEDQSDFKPVVVTAPRGTSEQSSCLFANSRFANFELFKAQFTSQEFQGVDIAYYYGAVSDWSASNGTKKKDWIATVRNFIRHDKENKKVHMLQGGLSPDEIDYLKEMADLDNPPVWEN